MPKYICTFKYFDGYKLWRVGDIFIGSESNLPKNKKGEMQFFRLLEGEPPEKPMSHIDVKVNEKYIGREIVTEAPQKEALRRKVPKQKPAEEVKTCDICGIYKGRSRQIKTHKLTCEKRYLAEKSEQEKADGVQ